MTKSLFQPSALLILMLVFFSNCSSGKPGHQEDKQQGSMENKEGTRSPDNADAREYPVISGDFADPSVIRRGDIYYATGTSSEWAPHFPIFKSADLFNWKQIGFAFNETPSWASSSFWAPEFFYWKETYYLYYVARKKSDGISCIGVATSTDPAKGFTDKGILLEFGKEAIDPFVIEEDGELYMTWKAYGLDQRPIEILGAKMSEDGLKITGQPFMLLRDDARQGLEGQCLVKRDGYYYIFYSPGNCCGRECSYKTEVARSVSLKGPYDKFSGNPLLSETNDWKCTGHGTLVTTEEGKDYFLYHAYNKTTDVFTGRQAMLGEVSWMNSNEWPSIKPLGEKANINRVFRDDFNSPVLSLAWQWDFRHAQPKWKIENNSLYLSGRTAPENESEQSTQGSLAERAGKISNQTVNLSGTALTVRPISGNYEMTTEVINQNSSLKGLVLYGDAGQAVGIGIRDNIVEVWEVKKDKRSVLKEESLSVTGPVQLKMTVENGHRIRFSWKANNSDWKEISTGNSYYDGNFLPPWDRSPRPGVLQQGTEPAVFEFFEIRYN